MRVYLSRNIINIPSRFPFFLPAPFPALFHSFSRSLESYLDARFADCSCRSGHVAEYLRPITIRGKPFARTTNIFIQYRVCPLRCYEIHPTKCVLRFERRAFVRLTRSFAQRRTRATFTKPPFIWLGGGGLCTDAYAHRSTQTQKPTQSLRKRPFYDARFSDTSPTFPCFITFAIISVRRVQSHETISILIHHSLA